MNIDRIVAALGRTPSLTELGIYSVMWSEHCSYKSSASICAAADQERARRAGAGRERRHHRRRRRLGLRLQNRVAQSPSYIEPYQGAATGVGGILRDIFTMGARPLAVMDSLRFGPSATESPRRRKNWCARTTPSSKAWSAASPATAIASACPTSAARRKFEACYSGNPLVNAFALGLVRATKFSTPRPRASATQ